MGMEMRVGGYRLTRPAAAGTSEIARDPYPLAVSTHRHGSSFAPPL